MASSPARRQGGDVRVAPPRRRRRRSFRQELAELAFVAPAALLVGLAVFVPVAVGLGHSFTAWQPGGASPWVGLGNFRGLLGSSVFREIVGNEFFYLLGLPLWVFAPILLALLLHERVPLAGVLRTILFFPSVVSPVIIGIVFTFMLGTDGIVNTILGNVGLGGLRHQWLTEASLVKPVVIVILGWAGTGTGVVLFSASLSSLPPELLEAARIDGARWWAQARYVIVPHLVPVIVVYGALQVINIFLWSFAWIYVLTQGGPGYASTTLDYDIYSKALGFGQFGLAAAESTLLLILVGVIAGVAVLAVRLVGRAP